MDRFKVIDMSIQIFNTLGFKEHTWNIKMNDIIMELEKRQTIVIESRDN